VNLSALGSGSTGTLTVTTGSIELGAAANYGTNFAPPNYTMSNVSSIITTSDLQTTLGLSNVVVNANEVVSGVPVGTIDLMNNITWSSGNSLTLVANNAININDLLTMTGSSSAGNTIVSLTAPKITIGNSLQSQTNTAGALLTTGGISVAASDFLAIYGGGASGAFSALNTGSGTVGISFGNALTVLAGDSASADAEIKGTTVTINGRSSGVGNILVQAEDCSQAFIDGTTVNIGTTIRPRNLSVIGGKCSSDNEAYIGSLTGGSNVTIHLAGDLTLTGGSSGSGNKASIVSSGGVANALVVSAFDIRLQGGSGGSNNSARISSNGSSGIVTLIAAQDLDLTGGGTLTTASTAHVQGSTVSYTTARDTVLTGGSGLLNKVYIQGYGGVVGSVGRNQNMNGGTASLTSAEIHSVTGNVTVHALQSINVIAGGAGSETQAAIYASQGNVDVHANLDINLTTGTSTTSDAYIYSGNGRVGVVAGRDLTLTGSCTIPNLAYIKSNGVSSGLNVSSGRNILRMGNTAILMNGSGALTSVTAGGKYLIFGCIPSGGGEEPAMLNQYYKYDFLYELFYRLRYFNYYDWYLYNSADFWTNANYTDP